VQDLEDGAANGLAARNALEAGLAAVIPGLNPIVAVDDVEAERQGIDDLLDEVTLLAEFGGPGVDLGLERTKGLAGHGEHTRRGRAGELGDVVEFAC
jgi:hypothetical protein